MRCFFCFWLVMAAVAYVHCLCKHVYIEMLFCIFVYWTVLLVCGLSMGKWLFHLSNCLRYWPCAVVHFLVRSLEEDLHVFPWSSMVYSSTC